MSGSITASKLNTAAVLFPTLQASRLQVGAVLFPSLQASRLQVGAVLFPSLQASRLQANAVLLPSLPVSKMLAWAVLVPLPTPTPPTVNPRTFGSPTWRLILDGDDDVTLRQDPRFTRPPPTIGPPPPPPPPEILPTFRVSADYDMLSVPSDRNV